MSNNFSADLIEIQKKLNELRIVLEKDKNAVKQVEKIASAIAQTFIEQFYDIRSDDTIDLCATYQASIFWLLKNCPSQTLGSQDKDYFDARRYIGFLISDNILTTCSKDGSCPMLKLSETHLNLMQSLTLIEHIHDRAYLGWIERTGKTFSSSENEQREDFYRACNYIYKSVALCNDCPNLTDFNYWKSIYNSVRGNHEHNILKTLRESATSNDIDGLIRYVSYIFKFLSLTENFFTGEFNLSWQELRALLYFTHDRPNLTTIFELIILRVLISVKFSEYIKKSISYNQNNTKVQDDTVIDDFIDAQAWLFWFMNLCQNQNEQSKLDDFHSARRYVAFLIAENILDDQDDSSIMVKCLSLSTKQIQLLRGLSFDEYCQYRAYTHRQYIRFSGEKNLSGTETEKYTSAKNYLLNKKISEKIKNNKNNKTPTKNLLIRAKFQPYIEIRQAKINTLTRLGRLTKENLDYIDYYVEPYYKKIRTALDKDMNTSLFLPKEFHAYSPVFDMFEYILSLITPGPIASVSKLSDSKTVLKGEKNEQLNQHS